MAKSAAKSAKKSISKIGSSKKDMPHTSNSNKNYEFNYDDTNSNSERSNYNSNNFSASGKDKFGIVRHAICSAVPLIPISSSTTNQNNVTTPNNNNTNINNNTSQHLQNEILFLSRVYKTDHFYNNINDRSNNNDEGNSNPEHGTDYYAAYSSYYSAISGVVKGTTEKERYFAVVRSTISPLMGERGEYDPSSSNSSAVGGFSPYLENNSEEQYSHSILVHGVYLPPTSTTPPVFTIRRSIPLKNLRIIQIPTQIRNSGNITLKFGGENKSDSLMDLEFSARPIDGENKHGDGGAPNSNNDNYNSATGLGIRQSLFGANNINGIDPFGVDNNITDTDDSDRHTRAKLVWNLLQLTRLLCHTIIQTSDAAKPNIKHQKVLLEG